jgi:hypothetical protein
MLTALALIDRSMTNYWAGVSGKENRIIPRWHLPDPPCFSLVTTCTASYKPFLYRKRPPQQNGDRRKRRSSGTREWGHSCMAWGYCVSQAAQAEWCYQDIPHLNGCDRTLMSRVRILTFLEKKGQNVGGRQHFELRGHFDIFWQSRAGTTSRASTAETPSI